MTIVVHKSDTGDSDFHMFRVFYDGTCRTCVVSHYDRMAYRCSDADYVLEVLLPNVLDVKLLDVSKIFLSFE